MSRPAPPRPRFPVPLARLRDAAPPARARVGGALERPQETVRHAASKGVGAQATGLGLDSAFVRQQMVRRLRLAGITDDRVLAAFAQVERHRFVDSALANQAYEDTSLPIGFGQTISKPSVVALMLQALMLGRSAAPLSRVMEIGTGCGYQAALLSTLATHVVSIERLAALAARARNNLCDAGVANVEVRHGDGRLGAPDGGAFDAIISAAGGDEVPPTWLDQLAPGGRLVAPAGTARPGVQALVAIERTSQGFTRRALGEVFFVPLKSGAE